MTNETEMRVSNVARLPTDFLKAPRVFLGITFCKHIWKKHWHSLDESTQVELERCARCLKDKDKKMGRI